METRDVTRMRQALETPFSPNAIKQRQGAGGRMLDYIPTHTVIRRLNDATNSQWDFHVVSMEWRNDLVIALGELTIPGMGTRAGIGVQRLSDKSGEDLVKGVASDSLKKAATLFGVGLDLYGPDYEAGEIEDRTVSQRAAPRHDGSMTRREPPGREDATPRQREMVRERWGALRLNPDLLDSQTHKLYGAPLDAISRDDAADLIAKLDQKITAASPRGLTPQPDDAPREQAGMSDAEIHEIALATTGTAGADRFTD